AHGGIGRHPAEDSAPRQRAAVQIVSAAPIAAAGTGTAKNRTDRDRPTRLVHGARIASLAWQIYQRSGKAGVVLHIQNAAGAVAVAADGQTFRELYVLCVYPH